MSNKPRCTACLHRPGPRSTAPMAEVDLSKPNQEPRPKKGPCACDCHAEKQP